MIVRAQTAPAAAPPDGPSETDAGTPPPAATSPTVQPNIAPPLGVPASVDAGAPPAPAPAATREEVGVIPPVTAVPAAAEQPQQQQLKEVVVTAERREESAQSVATALSVLKGESLTENQIGRSANEILNYVPNASAVSQVHGRPRWWIRGVGTGQQQLDFSNPVGFYLDDVYISNATATGFPLFDLDRVEVLRGPQGTLWGKNTTGGAINVLTRRPDFASDGYLRFDYGTFNDRVVEGAAGDTIWKDHLAARIAFHYESRGARFTNLYTNGAEGQFQDGAVRLQLLGKIAPDLLVTGNVHFRQYGTQGSTSTTTSNAATGVYIAGYVPSTDINTVGTNAPANDAITQNGAFINIKWHTPLFTLTAISAYEDFRDQQMTDSDYTPVEISRGWTQARSYQLTQELRVASPRADRVSWVAGAFYFHEKIDSDTVTAKLPGLPLEGVAAANYAYTGFEHLADSGAVFGSATLRIIQALNVTGGLRFTTETRRLHFLREATPAGAAASFADPSRWWLPQSVNTPLTNWFSADPSNTWNNLTWDVTPQVEITPAAQVYFRYARGVKSGGYNTAATTRAALNVVQPERLDDLELGAKTSWLRNRLIVNASAFHYDYHNIQVNVVGPLPPTNTAVSYLQNVAAGRVYGAELEIESLPVRNLHVSANLGLLDTKFTDFQVLNGGTNYSGNQFVRSPHLDTMVLADYRIALGAGRVPSLVLAGDWHFTSRQFHYSTNQTDPLLQTPAFSLFNARIALVSPDEKVSLTLYAYNLANTAYRLHSLPGAAGATGDVAIWGEPRTVGLSLLARWW
jgi:iron complex outermembrane receptor protein